MVKNNEDRFLMKMKISNSLCSALHKKGYRNFHKKAVALHFGFVSDCTRSHSGARLAPVECLQSKHTSQKLAMPLLCSRPQGRYASQNTKIQANARMRFCKAKYPKGETVCECKRESTSGQPRCFWEQPMMMGKSL